MLDLNLNVASSESAQQDDSFMVEDKVTQVSGTSNSSIVNVADACCDESCSTRPAGDVHTFRFNILRAGGGGVAVAEEFFPENGGDFTSFPAESCSAVKWIDLSFGNSKNQEVAMKAVKKSRRGPRSRSSQYRGVTFYRRTGRWESHIWDCGKQVYLGGFDTAHSAARAYDRAAVKFRGATADINFNLGDYEEEMKQMKNLSKEEFVQILRRQSTGFSRGSSKHPGVTQWDGRMGQLLGKKVYDRVAIGTIRDDELDLNLGISPPLCVNNPKEGDGRLQYHSGLIDARLKMENTAATTSEHHPAYNPGLVSMYEENGGKEWVMSEAASSGFSFSASAMSPPSMTMSTICTLYPL